MTAFDRVFKSFFLALLMLTTSQAHGQFPGRGQLRTDVRGTITAIDSTAGTIRVSTLEGRQGPAEKSFTLGKDVEVALSGAGARRALQLFNEGKVSDLAVGTQVSLTLSADASTVDSILAEGPTLRGVLKEVKVDQSSLTVTVQSQRDQEPVDKSFTIASGAEIVVDDGRGRRLSLKEGTLADLVPGTGVQLSMSVDQKQVLSIQAEGPSIQGTIKSSSPDKKQVTLTVFPRRGGEEVAERTVDLASDAVILLDDGRGRRLSIKEGKLADIPAGSAVMVRLTADQKVATMFRAEGPIVQGLLRSVDANAGTVTIVQRSGRGENAEERTLSLAKDARIVVQGTAGKLADIKLADNGPFAMLRLTLDQKSVQSLFVNSPR